MLLFQQYIFNFYHNKKVLEKKQKYVKLKMKKMEAVTYSFESKIKIQKNNITQI